MTKRERASVVAVLRRAAEIVAEDDGVWDVSFDGVCFALALGTHDWWTYCDAIDAFRYLIGKNRRAIFYWPTDEAHRNVRVIALLLVAEAVEAGDWP